MSFVIREGLTPECASIGKLLADVYPTLEGFPTTEQQPLYYKMLENIGE